MMMPSEGSEERAPQHDVLAETWAQSRVASRIEHELYEAYPMDGWLIRCRRVCDSTHAFGKADVEARLGLVTCWDARIARTPRIRAALKHSCHAHGIRSIGKTSRLQRASAEWHRAE
jgi:hypothetical protein